MRCIRPIKCSQAIDGTITYSQKSAIPGLIGWEFPCRKCLPCRLNIAREKAIRAYHEAQMHEDNIFLTLTYDDEHLESPRLIKQHIIDFNKDLRNHLGNSPDHKIKIMYTGEYGEEKKRPHWHSLIFNYRPKDSEFKYSTKRGDRVFTSATIEKIWNRGATEFGDVTLDSASYVARYAAKKLVHGKDQDHDYHPIHQTPKSGLGKTWIEKYHKQTFELGYVRLPNGSKAAIPRYYIDWCKKKHPSLYYHYVTQVLPPIIENAEFMQRKEEFEFLKNVFEKDQLWPLPRAQVKHTILKQKFKKLQENLKL